ncbi:MAG: HD domain-containing protein [Pirellulales bacterium]|nr:HD domain-containing protein [Pirellulales bacterium]
MNSRLSDRFYDALALACRCHAAGVRKISGAPYVAHPLRVAGIVLEAGGNEDEAIAALLHDVVEDAGGSRAREEIGRRFGPAVVRIVDECSDTDQTPKPPWRPRKEAFLARLSAASPSARLIIAADKLDNLLSLIDGYHQHGEALWQWFRGGRDGTLWYHRAVVDILQSTAPSSLVDRLRRTLAELESLVT